LIKEVLVEIRKGEIERKNIEEDNGSEESPLDWERV